MVYIILISWRDEFNIRWNAFILISTIGIAITILYSAHHIHVSSRSIEKLGIKTNSTVMTLYVIVWSSLALTFILTSVCYYYAYYDYDVSNKERVLRLKIAYLSLFTGSVLLGILPEFLLLYLYLRLSEKLSAKATTLIAENLRSDMDETA